MGGPQIETMSNYRPKDMEPWVSKVWGKKMEQISRRKDMGKYYF